MTEVLVSLRFDTEDFVTPESNDALLELARGLAARRIRATFPLVAEKLDFLVRLGRREVLAALREHAVGYHSATHSRHPTIAEELNELSWEEGVAAFGRREEAGFYRVAEFFGRLPLCYTQPGANWVAEAFTWLRRWGVPLYYGEEWNSYLRPADLPYRYQGVQTWAARVPASKPFFTALPGRTQEAYEEMAAAYRRLVERGGGVLHLVAHPTELVTYEFWDAVNFAGGRNPVEPLCRPRLRPGDEARRALAAFWDYLEGLGRLPGVRFIDAEELFAWGEERLRTPRSDLSVDELAGFIRPEEELHWDWPIFAPGFRAPNLRRKALDRIHTLVVPA